MARHTFLADMASWVMDVGAAQTSDSGLDGDTSLVIPGQDVTFWDSASSGTQLTDLLDGSGGAITSVTSGSDGSLPQIQGPDGVRSMWADAAGGAGPRRLCVATDIGTDLTAIETTVAQNVLQVESLNSTSPIYVYYNATSSSYPSRPSTGAPVWWVGPVPPVFGGDFAVDGLDYWIGPAQ